MKFQLLLKGCTIEAALDEVILRDWRFQLLLKGCTIEARSMRNLHAYEFWFQLLLKGCTIEAKPSKETVLSLSSVSVVVERMYD